MKILLFADLHAFDKNKIDLIEDDFDIIVFLGDINSSAISYILSCYPDKNAYGILENHDSASVFASVNNLLSAQRRLGLPVSNGITDIHAKRVCENGISFVGFQGSRKYKEDMIGFTEEEAEAVAVPEADLLFSHDSGYRWFKRNDSDIVHHGLMRIDNYIKDYQPRYHFFGHYHENLHFRKYNTDCFCIFGCSLFCTENGTIKNIFC